MKTLYRSLFTFFILLFSCFPVKAQTLNVTGITAGQKIYWGKVIPITLVNAGNTRCLDVLPTTPEDIVQASLDVFEKAGIKDNLSMQRAVGLESMIKRVKLEAAKYVKN
jgi:hypothetical protein